MLAPSGSTDLLSYLSGYSEAVVDNKCKYNMGRYSVPRTRQLEPYEQSRLSYYNGIQDSASQSLVSKISESTTQLTANYWTLRANAMSYGVNNALVSQANPFFGGVQSHGDRFVRAPAALTGQVDVQECTPNDPPVQ